MSIYFTRYISSLIFIIYLFGFENLSLSRVAPAPFSPLSTYGSAGIPYFGWDPTMTNSRFISPLLGSGMMQLGMNSMGGSPCTGQAGMNSMNMGANGMNMNSMNMGANGMNMNSMNMGMNGMNMNSMNMGMNGMNMNSMNMGANGMNMNSINMGMNGMNSCGPNSGFMGQNWTSQQPWFQTQSGFPIYRTGLANSVSSGFAISTNFSRKYTVGGSTLPAYSSGSAR